MFFLFFLACCFVTVPLLGGRLGRLAELQFRRKYVAVAAVVIQALILGVFPEGDETFHAVVHVGTYGLMGWFVLANAHIPGLMLMGLGGLCNAVAITANGGVMPADPDALARAGIVAEPGEFVNSRAVDGAHLQFLGDVFWVPESWPLHNVFSVGDVLLIVGAAVLLHRVCGTVLGPMLDRWAAAFARRHPRFELLREHPEFRRLWMAQLISNLGDWIYSLAVVVAIVGEDTGASTVSLLLICQVAPAMIIGIFGGPLVDRFSRRHLMIATDIVRGAAVATMFLVDTPGLAHVCAVAVVLGVGGSLFQPSFHASLPKLVSVERLPAANALVGATFSAAIMIGPSLGALIVANLGLGWGFAINALTFGLSAVLVGITPGRWSIPSPSDLPLARELVSGLRYMRASPTVMTVLLVVGLITLGAGLKLPQEPVFALNVLDAGPSGLGLLGTLWGTGMILGAAFASRALRRFGHGALLTGSIVMVGVVVVAGSQLSTFAPILALWACGGVANCLGTVAYETLLQSTTPDNVRGRVLAAVEASLEAGLLIGVVLAGVVNAGLGTRGGLLASGAIFLAAGAVSYKLRRHYAVPPAEDVLPAQPVQVPEPEEAPLVPAGVEVVAAGRGLSLLRVRLESAPTAAPVLLVDDHRRLHRIAALPGGLDRVVGYGVSDALLRVPRVALALESPSGAIVDLAPPPRTDDVPDWVATVAPQQDLPLPAARRIGSRDAIQTPAQA